jgi:hypothetical protein
MDNAKRRKWPFELTIEDGWMLYEKQNRKCALSGQLIYFDSDTRSNDGRASLDRIDSSKGYVMGNVQWVHRDINYMKQKYSQEHFVNLCKQVAENFQTFPLTFTGQGVT